MAVALVRGDLLYAWKGPSLLIVNGRGACGDDQPLSGFYHHEARFLRNLRLEINGKHPWLCEAAAVAPDVLMFSYVHPEITQPGGGGTGQSGDDVRTDDTGLPERSLDIRVSYHVGIGDLHITFGITNRSRREVHFDAAWSVNADFADIQEALSGNREQHAPVDRAPGEGTLSFTYTHEQLPYLTEILHGPDWRNDSERLTTRVSLAPQQTIEWAWRVTPTSGRAYLTPDEIAERDRHLRDWRARFSRVTAPGNRQFEAALAAHVRDFASFPLLTGPRDEWLAMQAGMPLYPAFFGRDAVTVGWQAGYVDRGESLEASLTKLGRMQSQRFDEWRDEEPGRIPYQVRTGPLALLNLNPYSAYYADYASPLMFVISLANLFAWTGHRARIEPHWDTARRILEWARTLGDMDGDGYLEYQTRSKKGTKNQGWKDSGDAIVYDDGEPVPSPIATCELQGYWYIAQQLMAALCLFMDAPGDAAEYRRSAADLKERFARDWWMADEQFVALALDPHKRQVRAVTSNVGHCLATGIIARDHLRPVVGRLFAPDMFSGWGVRTLSSSHAHYDPLSYHRGTIWPVEQATIIFGLRRFGFDARAIDLTRSMFELSLLYPEFRIPECVGGYARAERPVPSAYPRANTPQLWNATALPLAVQTLLGLVPMAPLETLMIDPVLPSWLPEVILHDLRVGSARVTLRFIRGREGRTDWDVLHQHGTLHIVRQPPPESVSAGWVDRAKGILETGIHL